MSNLLKCRPYVRVLDPRLEQIYRFYLDKTGAFLKYIIQSPGRVDIVGDHIDYHGFPVLPMAIEYSIFMACGGGGGKSNSLDDKKTIELFNLQSSEFHHWSGLASLDYGPNLKKDPKWYSFFLCGYHGFLTSDLVQDKHNLFDVRVAVHSDLPPAAGLSNSSALVCASALATKLTHLTKKSTGCDGDGDGGDDKDHYITDIDRREMAESCARYERLIGTHSGGMDQAVIMTADEGFAKLVQFMPTLNCQNVKLPHGISYLISHCGAKYFKAHLATIPGY